MLGIKQCIPIFIGIVLLFQPFVAVYAACYNTPESAIQFVLDEDHSHHMINTAQQLKDNKTHHQKKYALRLRASSYFASN